MLRFLQVGMLLSLALVLSSCAAQTKFTLKIEQRGEEKEYSVTCDNKKDYRACQLAEDLIEKPNPLRGESLSLVGCPGLETFEVEMSGRLVKKDLDATFSEKGGPCQKIRWQKIAPLIQELETR